MQRTSPRAQGLRLRKVLPMQASTSWADVAFSSSERDRHLGIEPVSQLNTWPVVSPVNASRRPSRDAAHHSGSGWLAKPSPWGTFTSYSLPASWRTRLWVNNGPDGPETPLPGSPEERTSADRPDWSGSWHQETNDFGSRPHSRASTLPSVPAKASSICDGSRICRKVMRGK